jgi:1,4-alpha-glucan branching enzyme
VISTATSSEQYDAAPPTQVLSWPESSWGKNGHHDVWMNNDVQWTWEREYKLERAVSMFMQKHEESEWDETMSNLVLNMFRQFMLAQSSDWQFLISTFSSREYAEMRFNGHATDAEKLRDAAERYVSTKTKRPADMQHALECEKRDGIFTAEITDYLALVKNASRTPAQ